MMTTTFKFLVARSEPEFATREAGKRAFAAIQQALHGAETIELDFSNCGMTPSFADECIGGLAGTLGLTEFKRRVKLVNVQDASKPLVRHLVLKAASKHASRAPALAL